MVIQSLLIYTWAEFLAKGSKYNVQIKNQILAFYMDVCMAHYTYTDREENGEKQGMDIVK